MLLDPWMSLKLKKFLMATVAVTWLETIMYGYNFYVECDSLMMHNKLPLGIFLSTITMLYILMESNEIQHTLELLTSKHYRGTRNLDWYSITFTKQLFLLINNIITFLSSLQEKTRHYKVYYSRHNRYELSCGFGSFICLLWFLFNFFFAYWLSVSVKVTTENIGRSPGTRDNIFSPPSFSYELVSGTSRLTLKRKSGVNLTLRASYVLFFRN